MEVGIQVGDDGDGNGRLVDIFFIYNIIGIRWVGYI